LGHVDKKTGKTVINNHLEFTIQTHKVGKDKFRIVGFEVEAISLANDEAVKNHNMTESASTVYLKDPQFLQSGSGTMFTYSIKTHDDPKHKWITRQDQYTKLSSHYEKVYHF